MDFVDVHEIILQFAIFFFAVFLLFVRGQLTAFHPVSMYLLFHFIVFCIRPAMVYRYDFDVVWNYLKIQPNPELFSLTLQASSFGLMIFVVVFSQVARPGWKLQEQPEISFTLTEKRAFFLMSLIIVPAGFASVFLANVSGERIGGVYIMTGTTGYLNDLQQVFVGYVVLFAVFFRWRWYAFLPAALYLGYRMTTGWGRWTIALTFLALMIFYMRDKRRYTPPLGFIALVPVLLIAFTMIGHQRQVFREMVYGGGDDRIVDTPEIDYVEDDPRYDEIKFRKNWDTLDFANFEMLAYVLRAVPEKTDTFSYGKQHLQLFTEPIPRAIWKTKPIGAPIPVFPQRMPDEANYKDYASLGDWRVGNFLGMTVSIIGDGWISGGWIGVACNMVFVAVVLGLWFNFFTRHQDSFFVIAMYLILLSMLVNNFRDGSLVTTAKFNLFTQMPIILWWAISRHVLPTLERRRSL